MTRSIILSAVFSVIALNNIARGDAELDGSNLLIASFEEGVDETFTLNIDGSHIVITHSSGRVYDEFYLPSVKSIFFYGDGDRDNFTNNTYIPSTQFGYGGNDTLVGGKSKDLLVGGYGEDYLYGKQGDDVLLAGDDLIEGTAIGGQGSDVIDIAMFFGKSERLQKGVSQTVQLRVEQVFLYGDDFNAAEGDTMSYDEIYMEDLPEDEQVDLLDFVTELQLRGIR